MENMTKEQDLFTKFPKSQEAIKIDANARAFYMLLLRGDEIEENDTSISHAKALLDKQ